MGGIWTNLLVNFRTIGNNNKTIGNANAHDNIQLWNQSPIKPSIQPKLRSILIIEMIPLMRKDKKNGIITVAHFVGSFGIFPMIFGESTAIAYSSIHFRMQPSYALIFDFSALSLFFISNNFYSIQMPLAKVPEICYIYRFSATLIFR